MNLRFHDHLHRCIERLDRHAIALSRGLLVLLFLVTAALGLFGGDRLRYPDEREYHALAGSLLAGGGYVLQNGVPTAYRPPGWPVVLAGLYRIWPRPLAAKLFNAAAYAAAAGLLSVLVGRIRPAARVLAPLLMLCYPLGLYTASTLYPQTFGTLLLIAVLLLLFDRAPTLPRIMVAGLLLGALILSIPSFLLATPLILLCMAMARPMNMGWFLRESALILLCAGLVIAPWALRNARIFGRFIPVSTNAGVNLLLGNSENARPNSGVNVDITQYLKTTAGMNEAERDDRLRRHATSWMLNHPRAWIKLYALKTLNYFNFKNELFVREEQSPLRSAAGFLSYYPLLAVAVAAVLGRGWTRLTRVETALYALYFGNALLAALVFTRLRFRVPFDALLIGIAAARLAAWAGATEGMYADFADGRR